MSCNCNNIYPDEDLRRWSVCQSTDLYTYFYTKAEIDEKFSHIDVDLSDYYDKDETDALLQEKASKMDVLALEHQTDLALATKLDASAYTPTDLSNYLTKYGLRWVHDNDNRSFALYKQDNRDGGIHFGGDVRTSIINTSNESTINFTCMLPIRGQTTIGENIYGENTVNGLLGHYNVELGRYDTQESCIYGSYSSDYNQAYWNTCPYLVVGGGYNNTSARNLFVIYDNGFIKIKDLFGGDIILQEWIQNIEDHYASKSWIEDQGFAYDYDVYNGENGLNSKQSVLISGQNIKTINGQSLLGSGNITISGGGSADLSNYYTKTEVNNLITNKADISSVTPINDALTAHTANTGIHVSQEEKNAWNAKMDASGMTQYATTANTYTKQEVNNIVNNKFWCGTQAQYNALTNKENGILYLIYEV